MTRRALVLLALLAFPLRADAHVGSPDVFFEGDAGPYRLFVTVRVPQVIPGVATIEIRSASTDVRVISVVSMRLTGPGSEHPPKPDVAERSGVDPQFFTTGVWLMEHGSMQVRIAVDGARGDGTLAVPVPAVALRTLPMTRGLGAILFGLMMLLALALVSIVAAAVREATLEPGVVAGKRARLAIVFASIAVAALLVLGNGWWNLEAASFAQTLDRPWRVDVRRDNCQLVLQTTRELLLDHGHEMHLFLIRVPGADQLVHLHPHRLDTGELAQALPSLPAGRYQLFADIVLPSGFPVTGTAELELPALSCPGLAGDDSAWSGDRVEERRSTLPDGGALIWDRPAALREGVAMSFRFHVVDRDGKPAADLEPYMGMAAHAEIVRSDMTVFAHVHPSGSVAMPALELASPMAMAMPMPETNHPLAPEVSFPYGFPRAGSYRVFVQIKRAGQIQTGAFDAVVAP